MVLIGYSTAAGPLPLMIRKATEGDVSHAFIAVPSPEWGAWQILGADEGGWVARSVEQFRDGGASGVELYELSGIDLWRGLRLNRRWVGAPYDVGGLLGEGVVLAWHHLAKRWIANPLEWKRRWFCSEIQRKVIEDSGVGLSLSAPLGSSDPAMVRDAVRALPFARRVDEAILLEEVR